MKSWHDGITGPVKAGGTLAAMASGERLAREIKFWRRSWRISQRLLAERAGTTQRVISLIEAEKYNPSLELLERLAAAMEMRLELALRPDPGTAMIGRKGSRDHVS